MSSVYSILNGFHLEPKRLILFLTRGLLFNFFANCHIHIVVSMLPNAVKVDVENDAVLTSCSSQWPYEKYNERPQNVTRLTNFRHFLYNLFTLNKMSQIEKHHFSTNCRVTRIAKFSLILKKIVYILREASSARLMAKNKWPQRWDYL